MKRIVHVIETFITSCVNYGKILRILTDDLFALLAFTLFNITLGVSRVAEVKYKRLGIQYGKRVILTQGVSVGTSHIFDHLSHRDAHARCTGSNDRVTILNNYEQIILYTFL